MTMKLLETITAGSGGISSFSFSGIPQTGTDLVLVVSMRDSSGGFQGGFNFNINGLSAGNYSWRVLTGNGGSASSAQGTNITTEQSLYVNAQSSSANTFTSATYYFPNYSVAGGKTWSIDSAVENNGSTGYQQIVAARYGVSVAGITSIVLTAFPTFVQNSTASLYTITKGTGGATVS